ncbi:MAG TPA: nitrous oxide reductase family maturation protein NosD [Saprospirales bacterium]|nr:nitrous oxide reductase family maturation protein NosD [Saprospirales bacterium]
MLMTRCLTIGVLVLLFGVGLSAASGLHVGKGLAYSSILTAVEQAQPGDTVWIHEGLYSEGNIAINKPIALIGIGYPILDGLHNCEIITVNASDVLIQGLEIRNSGQLSTIDLAGIKVLSSDRVRIIGNKVLDCTFGIYLSNTNDCLVSKNSVSGIIKEEQNSGNGIHLWKCARAVVEENHLTGQRDGIYFEFVTDSEIRYNHSEYNLRYGLHFMFSHNDHYHHNRFHHNGAGVAVMYSRQVKMTENEFGYNWGSSAYGLLLKDISDSHIWKNIFEHNSAGVYMEGASRITLEQNQFRENGWALRVQASCDANIVRQNNFFGNTFDVSTNGSLVLNSFESNYWDRYEGYDLNHDGIGDVPFRPVSLYAVVVERMPFGLMLMRSFMVYLLDKAEKIIPSLTPEMLKDDKPFMKPIALL